MARKVHHKTSLGLPHNMKLLYERKICKKTCLRRAVPVFWGPPSFKEVLLFQRWSSVWNCTWQPLASPPYVYSKFPATTILDKISLVKQLNCWVGEIEREKRKGMENLCKDLFLWSGPTFWSHLRPCCGPNCIPSLFSIWYHIFVTN